MDYHKKVLHVTAQAGRPIDISGLEKGSRTKQRLFLIFEVPGFDEYSENLIKSSTIEARKIASRKESVAETREIPYNNAV
ncbi:hypothetical protein [Ventrimonas faecis]|uniref:hypothetical protein n=1 Tax=Ventrimonas faecis TaxID=3133170 RepID=UPI0032C121FD